MALLLLVRTAAEGLEAERFDAVLTGDAGLLAGRYDAVVPADGLPVPPLVRGRAALLCTTLEGFERWAADPPAGFDVVFQPSALARLDLLSRRRATLVAARPLPAGHRLGPGDLAEETGGRGADASLRHRFIGRRLAYALAEGQALDFGMVEAS
ncbi:MAG: hypothetical protein OHK0024_11430 [Thalassobaculales bacterium]